MMVDIVEIPKMNLYVSFKIALSPTSNPTTAGAHAAIMLFKQIPLPAEPPMACRANKEVFDTPIDCAARD